VSNLKIAKEIISQYGLESKVTYTNKCNLGRYVPETDTIYISRNYTSFDEFLMTIVHEIKHALDCLKLGRRKYIKKYNQASNLAINQGLDPYVYNKWEIKAERYAENNYKKWEHLIKQSV